MRWSLKASLDWANEMTQNDGLMWASHTEVRCGQSLQSAVCSCRSYPASPPSPLFVQSILENVLGLLLFFFLYSVCLCNQTQRLIALFWGLRGLWHCSTLIDFATLSIYVSPLLIFSVTQAVSLGSVNTVWESLWHYVHSISELKKHQQTLIPRQETPLQHKATSQSLAVKISRNLFQ